MRKSVIKKISNKSGQAMVVLLIFLAIAMLLVTSASFSAIKSTEVVRRNINFQTAFDKAESLVNRMAVQIDSGDTKPIVETDPISGTVLGKAEVKYNFDDFITLKKDNGVNIDIEEQRKTTPLADGAVAKMYCKPDALKPAAIEFIRVFKSGGTYTSNRVIVKCAYPTDTFPNLSDAALMDGYDTTPGVLVRTMGVAPSGTLVLVRMRAIGNDVQAKLSISQINGGPTIAGTSKYVIVSSGLVGDGSASSTIQVEKPAGFYTPNLFDYVFFQGN